MRRLLGSIKMAKRFFIGHIKEFYNVLSISKFVYKSP